MSNPLPSTSSAPITCGGGATDYTRTFKKHFGNRPTAFALSPHSHAAPASTSSHSPTAANRGGVEGETQNALANLGWRIRSKVNQGYSRTITSSAEAGFGFRTEREVLADVTNSHRGWSRVATAPVVGGCFDDLRQTSEDISMDDRSHQTALHAGFASKRGRSNSNSESETEPEEMDTMESGKAERKIRGLPQLSFSSSISSHSSQSSHFGGGVSDSLLPPPAAAGLGKRTMSRSQSSTVSPFSTYPGSNKTNTTDEDERMIHQVESKVDGVRYDFSCHFDSTDF